MEELPAEVVELVEGMTCDEAARRFGLSEVAEHMWMATMTG